MKHLFALGVLGCALASPAWAADAATDATAACERAARETLRSSRGAMADATFSGPPTPAPGLSDGDDVTLSGAGRYRASGSGGTARPFSYSCSVNRKTAVVTGVVLRESGDAAPTPAAARTIEPDLSNVSPEACESSAAAALKQRWPSVSRIAFSAGALQLQQDADGQATLRGKGIAQPTPRDPDTHFSYRCMLDARSGRVLATRIGD